VLHQVGVSFDSLLRVTFETDRTVNFKMAD